MLYDDKVGLNENITRLYNKKLISGKIYRIIILLLSQVSIYYQCKNDIDEVEWFKSFIDKYKEKIYEVLVYVVINCGEENYHLVLSSLNEQEKRIFKKYLNYKNYNTAHSLHCEDKLQSTAKVRGSEHSEYMQKTQSLLQDLQHSLWKFQ